VTSNVSRPDAPARCGRTSSCQTALPWRGALLLVIEQHLAVELDVKPARARVAREHGLDERRDPQHARRRDLARDDQALARPHREPFARETPPRDVVTATVRDANSDVRVRGRLFVLREAQEDQPAGDAVRSRADSRR
jgi:hypothetical protein